jgi:hypothetical protein
MCGSLLAGSGQVVSIGGTRLVFDAEKVPVRRVDNQVSELIAAC